jgi:hypothetical protein
MLKFLYLLPFVLFPGLLMALYISNRSAGAGAWRALEKASSTARVLTLIGYAIGWAALAVSGAQAVALWILPFLAVFVWLIAKFIEGIAKTAADALKSADTRQDQARLKLQAQRDIVFYKDDQPVPELEKQSGVKGAVDNYFGEYEATTGRPTHSVIGKIDAVVTQAEAVEDLSNLGSDDGDMSLGATAEFTLVIFFFVALMTLTYWTIGLPPSIFVVMPIVIATFLSFRLASWTWESLPASVRLGTRIAIFFWPVTLFLLWYLIKQLTS